VYLALYVRRAWVIFDHPYNADSARMNFLGVRCLLCADRSVMALIPMPVRSCWRVIRNVSMEAEDVTLEEEALRDLVGVGA
jgi:hypothetical protein